MTSADVFLAGGRTLGLVHFVVSPSGFVGCQTLDSLSDVGIMLFVV